MLAAPQRSLCVFLALFLAIAPAVPAQQSSTAAPVPPAAASVAPIPQQILSARAVFISNGGGSNYFDLFSGGADRAYNTFYADIQRSGRYELVASPAQADLIFQVKAIAPMVGYGDDTGPNPQVVLSIQDPKTNTVLWTTRANVRAIGTKKRRDRQFDESVGVLVDKLAQVTGQPLTAEQMKAVNANSRMSRAEKILIVVSIAAAVGLTTFGIYRATHPPALQMPTPPPGFGAVR